MCVPKGRDGDGGAPIRPAANGDSRFEAPLQRLQIIVGLRFASSDSVLP